MDPEGKLRRGEKEIEYQHTANGRKDIAAAGGGRHGGQQRCQKVNSNDIGFRKADLGKAVAQNCCQNQYNDSQQPVPDSDFDIEFWLLLRS